MFDYLERTTCIPYPAPAEPAKPAQPAAPTAAASPSAALVRPVSPKLLLSFGVAQVSLLWLVSQRVCCVYLHPGASEGSDAAALSAGGLQTAIYTQAGIPPPPHSALLSPTPPQIGTWTPKGSTRPAHGSGGPTVSYRRAWGISVQRDDDAYLWARWLAPVYSVTVANIKTAMRLQVG